MKFEMMFFKVRSPRDKRLDVIAGNRFYIKLYTKLIQRGKLKLYEPSFLPNGLIKTNSYDNTYKWNHSN